MTAYASLTSLMHLLEQIQHHPRPPITIDKQQIEALCENVSFLQDFLETYSHKGGCKEELESQIADAAYAAEEIIESHVLDQILAGSANQGENNYIHLFFGGVEKLIQILSGSTSHGENGSAIFCQALRKVIDSMDSIRKEVMKIKDQQPRNSIPASTASPSCSSTTDNSMVGFDHVLNEVMDKLTSQQSNRQIMPIVGMGGIGKTTLAKNAYDHPFIVQHFHVTSWITISQEYSIREILLGALSFVRKKEDLLKFRDEMTEDKLGEYLYKSLSGMTYLIVMDDMWSIEAWDEVKSFFPDNSNGSRIIITTRLSKVANHFGSFVLEMNFLDEDQSWSLLRNKVFGQEDCPLELEGIGKTIARNCKGLPLSIVVIGGFLAKSDRTIEYWEYVSENLNSIVNVGDDERCLKILSLSYNHLPPHLKPCFLYIGVCSGEDQIRVSWFLKLWVAEGFLKQDNDKSLEVVAQEYLKDLIDRSLILVCEWGSRGRIKICNVHDRLKDLCLREAQKEKFSCAMRMYGHIIPNDTHTENRSQVIHALPSASCVRSLIRELWPYLTFRLPRVLNVRDKDLYDEEIRAGRYSLEVFQLINSRFLALRTFDKLNFKVPSSVCLLWNLQILVVEGTVETVTPPKIWEMPQLRHLVFESVSLPDPPSCSMERRDEFILQNLQTLLKIEKFRCSEEVVQRIPNVKKLQFPMRISLVDLRCGHITISPILPLYRNSNR